MITAEQGLRELGIARLVAQVQAIVEESGNPEGFDAAGWIAGWLERPLPALGGHKPAEFMDTAEGQAMVANMLERAWSGAYS